MHLLVSELHSLRVSKAIELETKKFELGLIEKALSTNEDRDSAINQIYFLIDLGLIETIQKETIQKTKP